MNDKSESYISNKKGQLGKIISSFSVMVLIFVVIAIYLVIAGSASLFKKASVYASIEDVDLNKDILLKEIEVSGEKFDILSALIRLNEDTLSRDEINDGLKKIINEGSILLLAKGENDEPGRLTGGPGRNNFIIEFKDGEMLYPNFGSYSSIFAKYRDKGLLKQASFDVKGKKLYVEYYYGGFIE